jgi:hypothetical protein
MATVRGRSLRKPLLFFIGSKSGNAEHCKNDVEKQIIVQLRRRRGCQVVDGGGNRDVSNFLTFRFER